MTERSPARILYCETNADGTIGGSYYSLLYLARGLDRTRFTPIALFYTEHSLLPAFRAAGIETVVWSRGGRFAFGEAVPPALGCLRRPALAAQKLLNAVRGFLVPVVRASLFLRRRRIRVVHLNNSIRTNHEWMLAAWLTRTRCLTHERGINDRYSALSKYFGRRLDAVICISDAVRRNLVERGAGFVNLRTIHNGLDPDVGRAQTPPAELRATLGIDRDAEVVVMVGNLREWKGQHTVVHAIDEVRRVHPSIRCVLVGDTAPADREYERQLRSLVTSLGLEHRVVFAGFRRNVADFLTMADIVVHASVLPEPFGRVVLEAMACRRPVVASRAGGIPEIVEEGVTGYMFPPGDAKRLADVIVAVLSDQEEARRLGENGYERLLRLFHIDRNVQETERLYEALLGGNREPGPHGQS